MYFRFANFTIISIILIRIWIIERKTLVLCKSMFCVSNCRRTLCKTAYPVRGKESYKNGIQKKAIGQNRIWYFWVRLVPNILLCMAEASIASYSITFFDLVTIALMFSSSEFRFDCKRNLKLLNLPTQLHTYNIGVCLFIQVLNYYFYILRHNKLFVYI